MCICVLLICIFVYICEDRNQVSTGQRSFVSKAVLMANKGSHHLRHKFLTNKLSLRGRGSVSAKCMSDFIGLFQESNDYFLPSDATKMPFFSYATASLKKI